jgi:hypothetical protein
MSLLPLGLLSQGGGGAAATGFELIETQLISSTTSSLTFSSIPGTYKHLQVRTTGRTTDASDFGGVAYRFNGDTGSNYTYHILDGDGSSVTSSSGTSQNMGLFGLVHGNTSPASSFGAVITDILDYANSNKYKTVRSLSGRRATGANVRLVSSAWLSTSAVTSLTILDNVGGSFVAGTRFSLYGIGG